MKEASEQQDTFALLVQQASAAYGAAQRGKGHSALAGATALPSRPQQRFITHLRAIVGDNALPLIGQALKSSLNGWGQRGEG